MDYMEFETLQYWKGVVEDACEIIAPPISEEIKKEVVEGIFENEYFWDWIYNEIRRIAIDTIDYKINDLTTQQEKIKELIKEEV